ncbi:DEAD/DEAH box helicase [Desulfobulbus sp. US4]|nr:DEAD/DEAH box helicase [Desulfobulbus sp. US4]
MAHAQQHLIAALLPDGRLQLERESTDKRINKSSTLLEQEIFTTYSEKNKGEESCASWLLRLGFSDPSTPLSPSLDFWRRFSGLFIHHLRLTPELEELRDKVSVPLAAEEIDRLMETVPALTGGEYLCPDLLASFWSKLNNAFTQSLSDYAGTVADFFHSFSPESQLLGRIYFHLVENKNADLPFAFLATYATRMGTEGESRHLPLKYALQEYQKDNAKLLNLLSTVHRAARESKLITDLLESNDLFSPLAWTAGEAHIFLQEVPLYEDAGILCRIPDWWHTKSSGISVKISLGDRTPAMVGITALLDFTPRLMLGDEELTPEEIKQLLEQVEGLAFIKNKWVNVDQERLQQTLAAYEEAEKLAENEGMTLAEAMRLQLHPETMLAVQADNGIVEVENGEWLQTVFSKINDPGQLPKTATDKHFLADLRPYQQDGLSWLCELNKLGFGACLADDMGLGKTVQILAFLNILSQGQRSRGKKGGKGKTIHKAASLLIIPASLLSNWDQEIKKFSPNLKVFLAHPDMHRPRRIKTPTESELDELDLVITTYALSHRYTWLQEYGWQYVILDEAQAIKNPGTRQSKAVKTIPARNRIAMTGTPVENRLSDLWSLFDFVNPGLLGTAAEFSTFSKALADRLDGYGRLRRMTAPFILRRLKSDKSIISDLPDKVEMKTWATLSKKQAVIYQQLVDRINDTLEESDGIQRKGMILAALTKFKQICNHPDQYAGVDGYTAKESGKFSRLQEICETIHEKREQVLVFTQFKEMTAPLARFLETVFQRPGLILHGSVAVGKRKKIIEQFQQDDYIPFMVLSLKAGGVGLNLTRANHVIHFDRWWNPAVENQATDRAFRIGQKKKVMVHKFVTKGTIEEKIDAMLTQKQQLSNDVVAASGESWLTEMNNDELADLFSLNI